MGAFSTTRLIDNGYHDGYIYETTCDMCGERWVDSYNERLNCSRTYRITEWDGTLNWVHTTKTNDDVTVTYMDGLTHRLSYAAYATLRPWWMRS